MDTPDKKRTKIGASPSIEETYQRKTPVEHILCRPDSYVGSVEPDTIETFVLADDDSGCPEQQPKPQQDREQEREQTPDDARRRKEEEGRRQRCLLMVRKKLTVVPGLFKIFDEILVNASDNKQRDSSMTLLKVTIDAVGNSISVWNNGAGIPVVRHKEQDDLFVPELIFGHLLTSSNFDDARKKTTGGRNGYGAKLTNIFSTKFAVETCDGERIFKQVFSANMSERSEPKVRASGAGGRSSWTKVTFQPDLARFGMRNLDADIVALMKKRVVDVAGTSDKSLRVVLDGETVRVPCFKKYVNLYLGGDSRKPRVHAALNERWEVCVSVSEDNFQQVSFVNGIATLEGGRHVQAVTDQVCKFVADSLSRKNKACTVKPVHVKNHLFVFVNCLVDNPTFDSQTKVKLTTARSKFGSSCELPESFLRGCVSKLGLPDVLLRWDRTRQKLKLKRDDGKKRKNLIGIPKLDDANWAGTERSRHCTLILTEGDSAKALAVSGLSVIGRDRYGVFPLKGKLLNTREASAQKIADNKELAHLKKILGLRTDREYASASELRYGQVMIMADQDHDGSHIKGLVLNVFANCWPSLLRNVPNFVVEFVTPIVKLTRGGGAAGSERLEFFSLPELEAWRAKQKTPAAASGRWSAKYYKGLGTSTSAEAKRYFGNLPRHQIDFERADAADFASLDLAFNKKKADARKDWVATCGPDTFLDQGAERKTLKIHDFVHRELILFSRASNVRAIPSVVDGLKPGQRKVLWACFRRNLTREIKVAQLAGYVSEKAAYHHGEAALNGTIVNMAHLFCGSNNVAFLVPNGQFGTRHAGGKDAASARYIFTRLADVTRSLFHPDDDPVLRHLTDDGQPVEPEHFLPVIPTVLVNGSSGIGTGWSTFVPNFNPLEIAENVRRLVKGEPEEELREMHPWYRGFKGSVLVSSGEEQDEGKNAKGKKTKNAAGGAGSYRVVGRVRKTGDRSVVISELPLQRWTNDYKVFLESLVASASSAVKSFTEHHGDNWVEFRVVLESADALRAVEALPGGLEAFFKLTGALHTGNMVLFDAQGRLKRYASSLEVVRDFFKVRREGYVRRKEHLVSALRRVVARLSNKARFVSAVVSRELVVQDLDDAALVQTLEAKQFERMAAVPATRHQQEEGEEEDPAPPTAGRVPLYGGFEYLLSMPMKSLTKENVATLLRNANEKRAQLKHLVDTSAEQLWLRDLDHFIASYAKYCEQTQDFVERSDGPGSHSKPGQKRKQSSCSSSFFGDGDSGSHAQKEN